MKKYRQKLSQIVQIKKLHTEKRFIKAKSFIMFSK